MPAERDELISLIAVTDGSEESLRALCHTAASVFEQTYQNLELIIARFGTEEAGEKNPAADRLLHRICGHCEIPVRLLKRRYETRAEAENAGMEVASGEWLLFLVCGDWLNSLMAERLYFSAKWGGASLALCGVEYELADGHIHFLRPETELLTDCLTFLNTLFPAYYRDGLLAAGSNQLFRTALVRERRLGFRPMVSRGAEQIVFLMQYLRHCEYLSVLPAVLVTAFPAPDEVQETEPQQEIETAFLLLEAYDALFDQLAPDDDVVNDMNNEMLDQLLRCGEHICRLERAGILSAEKSRKALEDFSGREAFRSLLSQTSPEGFWNWAAVLLLRSGRLGLYHRLLRLRCSLDMAPWKAQQEAEEQETAAVVVQQDEAEIKTAAAAVRENEAEAQAEIEGKTKAQPLAAQKGEAACLDSEKA